MSQNKPLDRNEIQIRIVKESFVFRLLPGMHTDALASLSVSGKLAIEDGKYFIPNNICTQSLQCERMNGQQSLNNENNDKQYK